MTSELQDIYASKALGYRTFGIAQISDGFGGSDGISPSSQNIKLDPAFGRVVPITGTYASISKALGTPIGNMTAMGGLASVFDGNTSQATANASNSNPSLQAGWVGKDFSASPQKIYACNVYGTTDGGYDTAAPGTSITLRLYGKNGSAPANATDGTLLGTTVTTDQNSAVRSIVSLDAATAWDYVWVSVVSGTFSYVTVAELDLFKPGSLLPMTIVTEAAEAESSPDTIGVKMLIRPFEALALNTDLIVEVSRDAGASWDSVTLVQIAAVGPDRYIEADPVTLTGAAGTDICARITTPTAKNVDLRGLTLVWE